MKTSVESIMSRYPITCREDESMDIAAQRMWEHDIGALPVTDGRGRAVGMLTDRDIAMAAYTQGAPLQRIQVHTAMSHDFWFVRPSSPVQEAEKLMSKYQVRRVAVVDDTGRPVGMVSINDLARRAGPSHVAPLTNDELCQTLRAVCQPRSTMPQPAAAQ